MYDFNLMDGENIIKLFENVPVRQMANEKITTIALTNKRLLFLDYITPNEGLEVLRVARGADYIRCKEVYYQIDLNDIESINTGEYYQVFLKNNVVFEFNNEELYRLLKKS